MALPKIDLPIFELELPSTGEKIKYRQYTVKEEKILLVAQESKDPGAEIMAMKQVVNNCLIDVEITDLAMFDLEYVHLVLRSKSVENTMNFSVKDPDTNEDIKLTLDVDNVIVTRTEGHTKEIRLNEDYVLFLNYPTIDAFVKISEMSPQDPLVNYFIMISCLDKIASEDEIHKFKDYTSEEVDAFMETLSSDVVAKIQKFFETMPRLRHELKYTNSNKDEKTFVIEGLRTFFI
ncbi:gp26 family baseplate hub assembly chaperone [bacterium]|nr:gp26 family baseplate hub assembly chaperone [bacterium]